MAALYTHVACEKLSTYRYVALETCCEVFVTESKLSSQPGWPDSDEFVDPNADEPERKVAIILIL